MTVHDLELICTQAKRMRLELFVNELNEAMTEYEINTPERQAAFIAQVAHESACFQYVRELASGDDYEDRADLGNTEPGDGPRFRGRGLIQITGRANYRACGLALGVDLLEAPEALEEPALACRSAAWFFKSKGLNELADRGDFKLITRRVNGGLNGWNERVAFYERAQAVLA